MSDDRTIFTLILDRPRRQSPTSGAAGSCLLILLAAMLSACSNLLPAPTSGGVLFQDDFSRPSSGWDRQREEGHIAAYIDGGYHISISAEDTVVWGRPHLDFDDIIIRVDAEKLAGSDDNVFGIICRFQDPQNYIFFTISSDGFAGIGAIVAGEQQMLHADAMNPADAVETSDGIYHLETACIDDELRLSVNGQDVLTATSPLPSGGDVGLLAGSRSEVPVEIRFDYFSVLQP